MTRVRVRRTGLCIRKSGFRAPHFVERVLIVGARGETALEQGCLAAERVALDRQIGLGADDIGTGSRGLRPQLASLQPGRRKLPFGLLERDAEGCRVDPEQ